MNVAIQIGERITNMHSGHLRVMAGILSLLTIIIISPTDGHAKLKCSSQKVLNEAYRVNERFWSPSDIKNIKYSTEGGRQYFSSPSRAKAMLWPRSLWVAGSKLYPIFLDDKGDYRGADTFEAELQITDRSIYGTKYTLA